MTFQHFSRQGRGDSQELESSHLEKQHVIYMEEAFLFIGILIRKSLPGEGVLSLPCCPF
jgi:hypothetical protein